MIETILFNQSKGATDQGLMELFDRWKEQNDSLIWVSLTNPSSQEDEQIANLFGFNKLEMADATRLRHPPKIEFFDDHILMILRTIDSTDIEQEIQYSQLAIFISERYIISRKIKSNECINKTWDDLINNEIDCTHGTSHIAYRISRNIADNYFTVLEKLEDRLEDLESLLTTDLNDDHLAELSKYNSSLRKINRAMTYHKNIFSSLLNTTTISFIKNNIHEFNDVYEHMERSASLSLMHQQLSSDLVNNYLALTSHRVNKIVKTLTIFTVLFVPLSFIAGLYGMNFEFIPELKFKYGYFYILGIMFAVFTGLLYFLRKMK